MTDRKRLTLALALPPLVWSAQGLFGWFAASHACPGTAQPWSLTTARWLVVAATVISLAVSIPALRTALKPLRAHDVLPEHIHYLSMLAVAVGATLTLGVVLAGLPALLLRVCGVAR
jgi:uncharacterized membrane protein YhaH (DUF805 family)